MDRSFMTRRAVLQSGLAATAAMARPRTTAAQNQARPPVVDTHLHCFAGKDDPRFPYHPRGPYQPAAPATPQHLLRVMDEAGVDYAVVVHPEPYQDDHRYLEYCLDVGKGRLKGTCLFFANRPGSVEMMPALASRVPLVAARIHAYAPDRLPPFGEPALRAMWKQIADLGLAVQLHFEPRYAPGFEPLIREFAGTRVIIDHLGRPFQGTPQEHAVVIRWSRLANTIMKLSSIPPTTTYPHRDIAPVIRQLTEAWGADRLICGGGFGDSATGDSYREAREYVRSYLSHLSSGDQAKVLGGTAANLFGFAAS